MDQGAALTSRDRVGDYIRRALPRAIERGGCDWPCHATYDHLAVRGYLTRGELVISDCYRRALRWEPVSRGNGDQIVETLSTVLLRWWRRYQGADERGWRTQVMWEGDAGALSPERREYVPGRAVVVELAPGVRFGTTAGGSLTMLYRLGWDVGVPLEEAEVLEWIRVE